MSWLVATSISKIFLIFTTLSAIDISSEFSIGKGWKIAQNIIEFLLTNNWQIIFIFVVDYLIELT